MSAEYAPTTEDVRSRFSTVWTSGLYAPREERPARRLIDQFDRWLAAHEHELRERIAQDIEAQAYDADGARTAISTGECTVEGVDTWDEAMHLAARIARGATR